MFRTLTFLFALALTALSSDPHPKTLRVMTYNTWYVFAERKEIPAGKEWINSQTPDVVALQELTNIQPEFLAELAEGWKHPHSALLKTRDFSVGLTSRWPIEVIEKRIDGMHHGYLHAKTKGIHYFVVHLSPFKWQVRQREAHLLLEKITPLIEKGEYVAVLGDFNANSQSDQTYLDAIPDLVSKTKATDDKYPHVQNLRDGKIDYSAMDIFYGSNLTDTSLKFLPAQAPKRFTIPTGVWGDKKTAPTEGQRVDYILACPKLAKRATKSWIPTDGDLNKISDHYPVITEFK